MTRATNSPVARGRREQSHRERLRDGCGEQHRPTAEVIRQAPGNQQREQDRSRVDPENYRHYDR